MEVAISTALPSGVVIARVSCLGATVSKLGEWARSRNPLGESHAAIFNGSCQTRALEPGH
jgi:hypothetical protein